LGFVHRCNCGSLTRATKGIVLRMNLEIEKRFAALEQSKTNFMAILEKHTTDQQTFKLTPETWSMTEVGQHLLQVEHNILEAAKRKPPTLVTAFNKIVFWVISKGLGSGGQIKTPSKAAIPQSTPSLEELKRNWAETRANLKAYLEPLPESALQSPAMRHPISGAMTLEMSFVFFERHILHHTKQLERIQQSLKSLT
jgi:uncharacterized damage-inducible protein DinB